MFQVIVNTYKDSGLIGLLKRLGRFPFRFVYYRTPLRTWWLGDHWLLGKYVEIFKNNLITIDGALISTASPHIRTDMKCRFILNRYEAKERYAVRDYFDKDTPIVELGASIGVVSSIANKKLVEPERHVVVEANTELLPILNRNKALNKAQFKIINKAIGYGNDHVTFYIHDKFVGGSAMRQTEKSIMIPTITLEQILKQFQFDLVNLICDIEGTEVELFEKEIDVLKNSVKIMVVDLHPQMAGKDRLDKALEILKNSGFELIHRSSPVSVFKNSQLLQ